MLSNAYFLAKFRFDTAENEPAKNLQKFAKFCKLALAGSEAAFRGRHGGRLAAPGRVGLLPAPRGGGRRRQPRDLRSGPLQVPFQC